MSKNKESATVELLVIEIKPNWRSGLQYKVTAGFVTCKETENLFTRIKTIGVASVVNTYSPDHTYSKAELNTPTFSRYSEGKLFKVVEDWTKVKREEVLVEIKKLVAVAVENRNVRIKMLMQEIYDLNELINV